MIGSLFGRVASVFRDPPSKEQINAFTFWTRYVDSSSSDDSSSSLMMNDSSSMMMSDGLLTKPIVETTDNEPLRPLI